MSTNASKTVKTPSPATADAAAAAGALREYVVLSAGLDDGHGRPHWHDVGRASALTNKQAIEKVVGTLPADEQEGTFIAVPVRSWVPLTRKTQTVTKALWS